ncbi:MAG: type IV secretory system conjugative DNA transfer family protein, partial [Candidatus Binataceae bacterium]
QDLSQIHAAYGHDEAITSNCHTRVAFTPNRIETARLLSQMTGETTVRHAHRTVSNSGASVSEPEVARPLITPDEVMRLGGNEALIFTSGRPAIRARKLRYHNEAMFKQLAEIGPPSKSDRIKEPADSIPQQPLPALDATTKVETVEGISPEPRAVEQTATRKPRAAASDPRQLSFLQSALEHDDGAPVTPERKERLL